MDGTLNIETRRQALIGILAGLVAMAGLVATFPRRLRNAILRILRPAESAARRLAIALSRGIEVALPAPRPQEPKPTRRRRQFEPKMPPEPKRREPPSRIGLPLLDPPWRIKPPRPPRSSGVPLISFGDRQPLPAPPMAWDMLDARRTRLRLEALGAVLADLPKQALRFARWRARQARARAADSFSKAARRRPLGFRPPGSRRWPEHEVDGVLAIAHDLALYALDPPDTS